MQVYVAICINHLGHFSRYLAKFVFHNSKHTILTCKDIYESSFTVAVLDVVTTYKSCNIHQFAHWLLNISPLYHSVHCKYAPGFPPQRQIVDWRQPHPNPGTSKAYYSQIIVMLYLSQAWEIFIKKIK